MLDVERGDNVDFGGENLLDVFVTLAVFAAGDVGVGEFVDEDDFGKIHFEGDHRVHVIKVSRNGLKLDRRFRLDFDTAFPTGPARPHGIEMK